jgi:hypothetical protein
MDKEKYKKAQDSWIEMMNLKVGDEVMVLFKAESWENGWNNSWEHSMTKNIGKILKVDENFDSGSKGIRIHDDFLMCYPFFVLKKIPKKLPENIEISDNYDVEFKENGKIHVGCQKIPFELLEKIYETAKSTR